MASTSYIDIHTHRAEVQEVLSIRNLYKHYADAANIPFCSIGIHPSYINVDTIDMQFLELQQHAGLPNVLAIGECGLDKKTETNWNLQEQVFKMQIGLANQLNKPIIIHCVRAYDEVLKLLKECKVNVPVIFHGFNKKWQLAQQILRHGYYLSLGDALLKKNAQLHETLINIPAELLFLETDDSGADIKDIYQSVVTVRKTSLDTLILQLQKNFETVFKR